MKSIHKVSFLLFLIYFIPFTGIYLTGNLILGKGVDLIIILIIGLILSLIFSSITSVMLKPRFRYLDSDKKDKPPFGDIHERIITAGNHSLDIIKIKEEVEKEWVLTHFNKNSGIIKFRSKISLLSWGVGAVLRLDHENKQLYIYSYPIAGYTQKGRNMSKKGITSIEETINNMI